MVNKKLMFLSSFFLSTLIISFSINNYQRVYQQMVEQNNNKLKLEKRKEIDKNFKSNITTNLKKFTEKSIEKMQVYRQADLAYYLAEEVIGGKEYKNQVLSFLKNINTEESEITKIINAYEKELISHIMYLNENGNHEEEQSISNFIDSKITKINWISSKTFESINFTNNFIKDIVQNYDLVMREIEEQNLHSKIEDIRKRFSLNLYEKVNKFLIAIVQFQEKIKEYLNKVLKTMKEEITIIKKEITKINTNLKSQIPANILKDLHNFETNYFAIKDIFNFLKSEDFSQKFTSTFLEINTNLLALEEFLLSTNKRIIDIIDDNINTISKNLKKKEEKITVPGVWETIVEDYKAFLDLEKEAEVISQDTKKMLNFDYNKIKKDIEKLKKKFDKIQYQGITQAIKHVIGEDKWKIYLSKNDTQKFKSDINIVTITMPVANATTGLFGAFYFMKRSGAEGASTWVKGSGAIFGFIVFVITFLLSSLPAFLINSISDDNGTGIEFEIPEEYLIGATLGAAIAIKNTVKQQEKKYLTID